MRSTTRVLWLTIITLMAVLTACAGTPPSPPAVALTAETEMAEIVPEDPSRAEETEMVSENPSRAENMTENENPTRQNPIRQNPTRQNPIRTIPQENAIDGREGRDPRQSQSPAGEQRMPRRTSSDSTWERSGTEKTQS